MLLRDVYRVMDPENSAREKEIKVRIWAMLIFKGCLKKKKKILEKDTEEQARGLSNVEVG